MSCYRYEGTHYLRTRHIGACDGSECSGCEPCPERHCGCHQGTHLDAGEHNCPRCVGRVRSDLTDIERLMAAMPSEALNRGVNSEAANLIGPAADPEAWSWRKVAAMQGRRDHVSLIEDDDPHHPKTVLGTWERMIREEYRQPTDLAWTLSRCVDYLAGRLTRLARDEEQDFGLLAREVRQCRTHLESVLHDGEQRDTGAPCMKCELPLVREWGRFAAADGWRCPKCREFRSDQDYRLNVADLHREEAKFLTDRDMEIRTGVKAGTVRVWAKRGEIGKRQDSGRTVYSVVDTEKKIRREAS